MEDSLKVVDESELGYARQRFKNRVFTQLVEFFETEAEERGIYQSDLAIALKKDAGQLSRLLKHPSNLTLETISDLLTALDAEMDTRIIRYAEQHRANYIHPLMARLVDEPVKAPPPEFSTSEQTISASTAVRKTVPTQELVVLS